MRLLITGSSGFVGRHLVRDAETRGADVIGLTRGGRRVDGDPARQCAGDVRDAEIVRRVVADVRPTHVVHLASTLPGLPGLPSDAGRSEEHYGVNVVGTINLLEAVLETSPEAVVILSSSSAVYGSGTPVDRPTRETDPLEPLSHYAASKASQEFIGGYYQRSRGVRVIVARPFNLVGPGLPPGLLATDVARQVVRAEQGKGEPIVEVGALETGRDFLDARDAAAAYLQLLERGQVGEIYNVCSGRLTPVRACVEQLVSQARVPVSIRQVDRPTGRGEVRQQVGDGTRLRDATGWQPRIALDASLRDLLEECRSGYEAGAWQ